MHEGAKCRIQCLIVFCFVYKQTIQKEQFQIHSEIEWKAQPPLLPASKWYIYNQWAYLTCHYHF